MLDLAHANVYLARDPVDMRRQIDGLALLTQEQLARNPLDAHVFVFCNKSRDKIKCLYWHNNGFCLLYKRLEKGRFQWPSTDSPSTSCSLRDFLWLLDGLNLKDLKPIHALHYSAI